jgi:hypothetical protein
VCRDRATESHSRQHVAISWLPQESITVTKAEEAGRRDLDNGKTQK